MSDLDPRVRALIEATRFAEPTQADRARVRAALALRLVPAPAPSPSTAPHAPGVSPPAALAHTVAHAVAGAGAKLLAAGAVIGLAGFGAGVVVGRRGPAVELARHGVDMHVVQGVHVAARKLESANAAAPTPVEPLAPAPIPTFDPVASPAPETPVLPLRVAARSRPSTGAPAVVASVPQATSAQPVAAAEPPPPEASTLVEETDLLRKAQMSLGAGDARAALARLDELGARHPDGLLREERLAARIVALCAAGRVADARREAARFLVEAPLSIHAARVRAACGAVSAGEGREPGGH